MPKRSNRHLVVLLLSAALAGCGQPAAQSPTTMAAPFHATASVQELMQALVDPSADGVWDAVGTTLTQKETIHRQPRTEEEWKQVRLHALALIEATNLLMMDGRRLIPKDGHILDEGSEGVLTTPQAEQQFAAEHATFVQFARALNEVGAQMLQAIDERKPERMIEVGETMDEVCETCHMKFWYPNQPVWRVTQGAK